MFWENELGAFEVSLGEKGISHLALADGNEPVEPVAPELAGALEKHIHGEAASLTLDLQGLSPMSQLTLAKLLEIPYGEVRSYSWVAREIGRPTSVRPVASAVAGNPIPLLIPCHRVVRSDGHIGEFSLGGAEMKHKILAFEGVDIPHLEDLARRGVRFLADKETETIHLPSCKKAPRKDSPMLRELHTVEEAREDHLEPCRRCRPISKF